MPRRRGVSLNFYEPPATWGLRSV